MSETLISVEKGEIPSCTNGHKCYSPIEIPEVDGI